MRNIHIRPILFYSLGFTLQLVLALDSAVQSHRLEELQETESSNEGSTKTPLAAPARRVGLDGGYTSCIALFSFEFLDFECSVENKFGKVLNHAGFPVCPFLYPFLDVVVNDQIRTTLLSESNGFELFHFGKIAPPEDIIVTKISAAIKLYFNASFNILQNVDTSLDRNRHPAEINTLLYQWEANFVGTSFVQRGDLSCVALHRNEELKSDPAVASIPSCDTTKYNRGFWDIKKRRFLPVGCAFPKPKWPPSLSERKGYTWLHLYGDSNMNKFQTTLCGKLGARTNYRGLRESGKNVVWNACLTPDGTLAIVYSVSWMGGSKALHIKPELLGKSLSHVLCRADTLPNPPTGDCAATWGVPAERTVIVSGSHHPEQLIPKADADVRGWVDDLLSFIERPETVVVMLTSGVCLRHFNPRHSLQLFQRACVPSMTRSSRLRRSGAGPLWICGRFRLPRAATWSLRTRSTSRGLSTQMGPPSFWGLSEAANKGTRAESG